MTQRYSRYVHVNHVCIGRSGAVLTFSRNYPEPDPSHYHEFNVPQSTLRFHVHTYSTGNTTSGYGNIHGLRMVIVGKRDKLAVLFKRSAREGSSMISKEAWKKALTSVTGMNIDWEHVEDDLVPPDAWGENRESLDFGKFLDSEALKTKVHKDESFAGMKLDQLHEFQSLLVHMFYLFDRNGDGSLSREEMVTGFGLVNAHLDESDRIENPEELVRLMDLNGDGQVYTGPCLSPNCTQ